MERIRARKYEPWMHVVEVGYNLITASIGAGLGVSHEEDVGHGCWVTDYPDGCGCKHGECCKSPWIAWAFGGLPVLVCLGVVFVNNLLVYLHIKENSEESILREAVQPQPQQSATEQR